MKTRWWVVEVRDENGGLVPFTYNGYDRPIYQDQVCSDARDTAEEIHKSLVEHDGYPSNITVRLMK